MSRATWGAGVLGLAEPSSLRGSQQCVMKHPGGFTELKHQTKRRLAILTHFFLESLVTLVYFAFHLLPFLFDIMWMSMRSSGIMDCAVQCRLRWCEGARGRCSGVHLFLLFYKCPLEKSLPKRPKRFSVAKGKRHGGLRVFGLGSKPHHRAALGTRWTHSAMLSR